MAKRGDRHWLHPLNSPKKILNPLIYIEKIMPKF